MQFIPPGCTLTCASRRKFFVLAAIKRLCERGVLKNDGGVITSLVSKDQAQAAEIDELVEKKFEGSIPAFVAAFGRWQRLSQEDIQQMQQLIDRYRKEGDSNV